jgi:hypothetical protein
MRRGGNDLLAFRERNRILVFPIAFEDHNPVVFSSFTGYEVGPTCPFIWIQELPMGNCTFLSMGPLDGILVGGILLLSMGTFPNLLLEKDLLFKKVLFPFQERSQDAARKISC